MGDIFGGNSFQLTLFLLADLLAGTPVIVAARGSDVWLGAARAADDRDRGGGGDRAAEAHVPSARGSTRSRCVAVYAVMIALLPKVT